jgi:DNA sulfur modification protein DndC
VLGRLEGGPQERLVKQLNNRAVSASGLEIVPIVGTRLDESATRAKRMTDRGASATTPVRNDTNRLVLSLIAHWKLSDVWDTIEMLADPGSSPYVAPISPESIERLFTLYRDANDGVCGVTLGDGGNTKICGSRFGCHVCTVSGDEDKSMESMLVDSRYSYMQPLNDFRNLLLAAQNDFDTREVLGRSVSEAEYIGIQPDVYSYSFRRQLLRYLLSINANERDRAEQMEADIAMGRVEDTPDNRMMSSPMFENVTMSQLAIVDWHWGMNYQAEHAFPALSIWYEVNILNRRALPPKRLTTPKLTLPTKRWFKVGNCDHAGIPSEGLRSAENELWNRHRHPERPFTYGMAGDEKTVWFEEDDVLSVDPVEACLFITCTFPQMVVEARQMAAIESTRWWLNEGIIKLPDGHAYRYQEIAKRNQYIYNLATKLGLSPNEMNQYLLKHSITNAEHNQLLAAFGAPEFEPAPAQFDLFSLLQAA